MPTCPDCGETTYQRKNGTNSAGRSRYRCVHCGRRYTLGAPPRSEPEPIKIVRCANCGKETTNPKFCCQSCSATYTNKAYPRRKKLQRFCKYCGTPIQGRMAACDNCNRLKVDWSKRTIGEFRQKSPNRLVHAQTRKLARKIYFDGDYPRFCQKCGYDKHIEICHIRPIGDFPDDTPMTVVNGLDNLVALCPNCHWEFDHGLLHTAEIPGLDADDD